MVCGFQMERCTDAYYNAISNSAILFTELAKTDNYIYDVTSLRDLNYNLFSVFLETVPALAIVETLYIADVSSADEKYIWWNITDQVANLNATNITRSLQVPFLAFNTTWYNYNTSYKINASAPYNTSVGYYPQTLFSDLSKGVFKMNAVSILVPFNETSRRIINSSLLIFEVSTCIKQYQSISVCSDANSSVTPQFISGLLLDTQKQGVIFPRSFECVGT